MQTVKYFIRDKKTKQLFKPGPGADYYDTAKQAIESADALNAAEKKRHKPSCFVEAVRLTVTPVLPPPPIKISRGERVKIERFMKRLAKEAAKDAGRFRPHLWIQPEHGIVELMLENVACYHEWIKKEGADMSIWRAMDNDRMVGATMPLRHWDGYIGVMVDS